MSELVSFAKEELGRLSGQEDEMQQQMSKGIIEMIELFSTQGHSGFSAGYAVSTLERLLSYKPLTELTGEESEWGNPYGEDDEGKELQQNKRYSSVFRHGYDNSTSYDIDARVFSDDGGETWFSGPESNVAISFPYNVPSHPERVILKDEGDKADVK